ncbi:MAG TPA: site-2 protease family protein [Longimicrobiaceae bacterium]
MRWSFTILRVAGTDVKIHVTFLLLLVWIGIIYYWQGGPAAAISGLIFILLIFASVLLHEFGHVAAARRYGIETPDITLLPIGGVARLKRMPDDPKQELVVALAGPAVNVAIAAILFLIVGQMADPEALAQPGAAALLAQVLTVNVMLVLFNLLPAFPMDGGRVLRAFLAMRMSYVRATSVAARIGQGMAFLFGFVGLFTNPFLVFIALFVYLGATQESAASQMRDVTETLPLSEAMVTHFRTLPPSATLADAADALLHTHQHDFPVVDGAGIVLGILTRDDLITALRRRGADAPVQEAMRTNIPSIPWWASFAEAFRLMQESHCPALPVTDQHGRLVGLLTPENVGEMIMIHGALRPEEGVSWRRSVRSL